MEVLDEIGEASRSDWHSSDTLWMNKTFIGLFCDPYTSDTNLEGGPPVPAAREMGGLSRRLARERRVEGLTDDERAALDKAGKILEDGADRTEKISSGMGGGAPAAKKLKEELLGMEPGDMALILGGWSKKSCPGHAVTYTLERVSEDDYAFTITNTGGGVGYHPSHAGPDCYPHSKPLCAWRLCGIKKNRLCHEAFLYSLMLPVIEADDKNGAGQLYEVHLPYLLPQHDGGLTQATCPEWGRPEFCTSAQKAGYCYFKCVAASLRYLWARFGISRERRKRLMLHIRRMAVGALEGNLAQLLGSRRKRPLPRAGQLVVELACRQLMLKAKRERQVGLSAEELAGMQRLVARVDRYAAKLTWDQRIPVSAAIWEVGKRAEVDGTGWPGLGLALRARQKEPGGLGDAIALVPPATLNLQLAKGEPADVLRNLLRLQRSILEVTEDRWAIQQAAAVVEWGVSRLLPPIQPDGAPWSQHRLDKGALTWHLRTISEIANTYASNALRCAQSSSPAHHAVEVLTIGALLAAYDATLRAGGDATTLGAALKDEVIYARVLTVVDSLPLVSPEWCVVRNALRQYRNFNRGDNMLASMPDMDEKKQWVFKKEIREGAPKATISVVERLARSAGLTGKASRNLHAALEALKKSDPKVDTLTIEDLGTHAKILAWMFDDTEDLARAAPEWIDYFGLMMLLQWIARSPVCRVPGEKSKTPGKCMILWKLEIKMIGPKMHKKPEVVVSGEFQSRVEAFSLDLAKLFPKSIADVSMHEPQASLHDEASVILLPQFSLPPFASHGELCLTEEEAESVLSALSTPYLRIPLLLQFFAEDRLPTLRHARLRAALESALAEPGTWGTLHRAPTQVPADPGALGTPEGLLMLEVRHNLGALWTPLASIINDASELSRLVAHDSGGTDVFMTVVRVVSRVHRAMLFAGEVPGAWQTALLAFGRTAITRFQRWFEDELSIKERPPDVTRCAKFQAHIVFSMIPRLAEFRDAAAALVALTYSSAWIPQKARKEKKEGEEAKEEEEEAKEEEDTVPEEPLGIGLCELWEVMQAWRPFVLKLLAAASDEERQQALNAAVRAVSHGADIKVDFADGAAPGYYTGAAAGSGQRITVDVQRFQVVFHDQALRPMPASITKTLEYKALFGSRYPNCRLQTYTKGSIANMTLGKESFELRLYKADPHRSSDGRALRGIGFPSSDRSGTLHFDGLKYTESRGGGEMLGALKSLGAIDAALDCLKDLVVDNIRDDLFKKEIGALHDNEIRLNWYVPERLPSECLEATLLCSSTCDRLEKDGWYEFRFPRHGERDGRPNPGKRLLRIFALVDHGRMPLRCEIWASDYRISTRPNLVPSVLPREKSLPFALRACAGSQLSKPWPSYLESLEIKRDRDGAFHIPNMYLVGLLPGVLLDDEAGFVFWLLDEGNMIAGEPVTASDWFNYRLLIQPGASAHEAVVRREPLKGGDQLLLLNAAGAPDGSPLLRLARLFAPFERLSHVLFWAQEQTDGSLPNLVSIEFPRLQLRLAPRECDEFGALGRRPAEPRGGRRSPDTMVKWQVMLGGTWKDFEPETSKSLENAHASGAASCNFESHGHSFVADFASMTQRSPHSDKKRPIRREAPPTSARATPDGGADGPAGAEVSRITRLESVEFDGFYVVELGELAALDDRAEQLQNLLQAVPHSLILRSRSGQVKVLVANALPVRPRVKELPFTVNLAFDFGILSQLSRRYFAWDLHVSGSLLLSTTLLGTLYLCLLRFLERDFIKVAKLLGSCTFDTELSPDEGRVFARFFCGPREEDLNGVDPGDMAKMSVGSIGGGVLDDLHPDAVALRLRLAIIGADYRWSPNLWQFRKYLDKMLSGEHGAYVSKLGHVSQLCRLTFAEERRLLGILDKTASGGGRRAALIGALRNNPPGPGHDPGLIVKTKLNWSTGAPSKGYAEFLQSCTEIGDWSEDRFWTYVHIDKDRQFGDMDSGSGIHLYKSKWQQCELCHDGHCAFVSLYAAIRGDADLQVCGSAAAGQISDLLTRYLWFNAKSEDGGIQGHTALALMFLHLLLRARRGKRHKAWPDFRDIAKGRDGWIHLTNMHGGHMSAAFTRKLWEAAAEELRADRGYMLHAPLSRWPQAEEHSAEVTFDQSLHWPPSPPQLLVGNDPPVLKVEEEDLRALLAAPTANLKAAFVQELEPVAKEAALAFEEADLRKLPGGKTEVARAMTAQLFDGVQEYATVCSSRVPLTMQCLAAGDLVAAAGTLQDLLKQLVDAWRADVAALVSERRVILEEAAYIPVPARGEAADPLSDNLDLWTGQRSGDVEPWLEWCLGALMFVDDGGGASGRLAQLQAVNRYLGEEAAKKITQRVLRLLLLAGRIGVLQNATQVAYGLLSACQKSGAASLDDLPPASRQQIDHAAGQLAAFLSVHREGKDRTYVQRDGSFDYRFLLFEYVSGFFLRQKQSETVAELFGANTKDRPYIKQMIMGGGKTACVAPLLTLLLAHPQRLVVNVVPDSLVAQTRDIMRGLFGIALSRQVVTLAFSREVGRDGRGKGKGKKPDEEEEDEDGGGSKALVESGAQTLSRLYAKLNSAMGNCAVVITTPVAMKSLMLKYVEVELQGQKEIKEQSAHLSKILKMMRRHGVALIDEVDWVLHPLKSELNFPLGTPVLFDDQETRVSVAMHLVDAVFLEKSGGLSASAAVSPRFKEVESGAEVQGIKDALIAAVQEGAAAKALQRLPHLLLHSPDYYHAKMRLPLCQWVAVWAAVENPVSKDLRKAGGLTKEHVVEYLNADKVHGTDICAQVEASLSKASCRLLNLARTWLHSLLPFLLTRGDRVAYGLLNEQERNAAAKASSPRSRLLMAVPFVAKDAPSGAAEFAHPDVLIGYTVLAYRHEGLRPQDVEEILHDRVRRARLEPGPYAVRQTCREFRAWVQQAQLRSRDPELKACMVPELPIIRFVAGPSLYSQLWELLQKQDEVIYWYLSHVVFPTVLRKQNRKLSASGQELGSEMIFRNRLGFSGTPSSLLPRELGTCDFDPENVGEIISTLSSPAVVNSSVVILEDEWSPKGFLKSLAEADPPFSALIDTGAIVTGMSNEQVARALLAYLPRDFCDGVVFLDPRDRQLIVQHSVSHPVPVKESGVPPKRRFCFYDQVHTTGIDVKHRPDAKAAITLSASLTYRDFAQGAWRMRGIGIGQTLVAYCTVEVRCRICEVLGQPPDARAPLPFVDALRFLLANHFSSEQKQFNVLQGQNLGTIWRKRALEDLLEGRDTKKALKEFEDSLAFPLPDAAPAPAMLHDGLQDTFKRHLPYMRSCDRAKDRMINDCTQLIDTVKAASLAASEELGAEVQKEKEQEKEQCVLKETVPTIATEDHAEAPWTLAALGDPRSMAGFYPLRKFRMTGLRSFTCRYDVYVTANHTRNGLKHDSSSESRQLKPVQVLLQWMSGGRTFTAAVSLAEAAALRKALHCSADDVPPFELWLRHGQLGNLSSCLGRKMLPVDDKARQYGFAQQQVLRLFNVDVDFTHEEVLAALETMQHEGSTPAERESIVQTMLGSRRREAMAWETTMLRKLVYEDSAALNQGQLLTQQLKRQAKGEASRLWTRLDVNGDLVLTNDELRDGLTKMGLSFSAREVAVLLRHMDVANKGCVHLHEFEAALRVPQRIDGLSDHARKMAAAEAGGEVDDLRPGTAESGASGVPLDRTPTGVLSGDAADDPPASADAAADVAPDDAGDGPPGASPGTPEPGRPMTSTVAMGTSWKVHRRFAEFNIALDAALAASVQRVEDRVKALETAGDDFKAFEKAVLAVYWQESKEEISKVWPVPKETEKDVPVLADLGELRRQRCPSGMRQTAMRMAIRALTTGELEEDLDAAAFGDHSKEVLKVPEKARKLRERWVAYKANWATLHEDEPATLAQAAEVLIFAMQLPMCSGLAVKALLRIDATVVLGAVGESGVKWLEVLAALCALLHENPSQPEIQECGLRVAIRVAATDPLIRSKLVVLGWTRVAATASAQHAGTSVATVAGWLLSLVGGEDPLVVATAGDTWSPLEVAPDGEVQRAVVALPPGSKLKLFACGADGGNTWLLRLPDRSGDSVYELFVNHSAADGVPSSVRSGIEADDTAGFFPFGDAQEPFEIVFSFTAVKVEIFVNGKRTEHIDALNPERTCKSVEITGLLLPHLWAQLQEEGGSTRWQIFSAGGWVDFPDDIDTLLKMSKASGEREVQYKIGRGQYVADLERLVQVNSRYGTERQIREPKRREVSDSPPGAGAGPTPTVWQIRLGDDWQDVAPERQEQYSQAKADGAKVVYFESRGQQYEVDLEAMVQKNVRSGKGRELRERPA